MNSVWSGTIQAGMKSLFIRSIIMSPVGTAPLPSDIATQVDVAEPQPDIPPDRSFLKIMHIFTPH